MNKYGGAEEQTRNVIEKSFSAKDEDAVIKHKLKDVTDEKLLNYALYYAVIFNRRDIIEYLVESKNVNIDAIINNRTVLYHAIYPNIDFETMAKVIDLKANVNIIAESVTPLIFAIMQQDYDDFDSEKKIKLLLEKGANINAQIEYDDYDDEYAGKTALHLAIEKK